MKRIIAISTVIAALLLSTPGHAATQQANLEKLSNKQLSTLAATAKTPAEHRRIANYYSAQAQNYLAESKIHGGMAEQFKANPVTNSSKFVTGTVNHCQYLADSLKASAEQSSKLAQDHEQMAQDAQK